MECSSIESMLRTVSLESKKDFLFLIFVNRLYLERPIQIPGCDYGRILPPLRRVRPLVPIGEDALEGQGGRGGGGGGGGGGGEPDTT